MVVTVNNGGARVLTLLFRPLSKEQADDLAVASQAATLCTGDSSPAKALALGKHFGCEMLGTKIPFLRSLVKTAEAFDPQIGKALSDVFNMDIQEEKEQSALQKTAALFHVKRDKNTKRDQNTMTSFFRAMQNPALKQKWDAFIHHLYKNHNFNPTLIEKIGEFLRK